MILTQVIKLVMPRDEGQGNIQIEGKASFLNTMNMSNAWKKSFMNIRKKIFSFTKIKHQII